MFKPIKVERKVLEKDVEAYLCRQVKARGGECFKWSSMNVRGVPDRIVVFPGGYVWFIEVKKDARAPLSKLQRSFIAKMRGMGMPRIAVVRGKEGVDAWIKTNAPSR